MRPPEPCGWDNAGSKNRPLPGHHCTTCQGLSSVLCRPHPATMPSARTTKRKSSVDKAEGRGTGTSTDPMWGSAIQGPCDWPLCWVPSLQIHSIPKQPYVFGALLLFHTSFHETTTCLRATLELHMCGSLRHIVMKTTPGPIQLPIPLCSVPSSLVQSLKQMPGHTGHT